MSDIASGIKVYYENKKSVENLVFFTNGTKKVYPTGGMLFELIKDESIYMITEKVENMIKSYPDFNSVASLEILVDGFHWLYEAIDDSDMPVAIELFRSCFVEVMIDLPEPLDSFGCVGDFMMHCYDAYLLQIQAFCLYFDAIANTNSGSQDSSLNDIANDFFLLTENVKGFYTRKLRVRNKVPDETLCISNFLQLLSFEYLRMKDVNKVFKICRNCGRYFIPSKRRDAIYCDAPAPQNLNKTCKEIGPVYRQIQNRQQDPVEREHHKKAARLYNMSRRIKPDDPESLKTEIEKEIKVEKRRYLKEKFADGDVT